MRFRRILLSWMLIAIPVILLPFLMFGLIAYWSFEDILLPQVEARAQIASEGLVRQLEFNAQFFGTLGNLREVGAALDDTRSAASALSFVAVYNEAGALIAMSPAGFSLPEAAAPFSGEDAGGWAATLKSAVNGLHGAVIGGPFFTEASSTSYQAGPYLVTELPVGTPDAPLGMVVAGTELALLNDVRSDIAVETLTIFIAALLIGFECVLLLILIYLVRPLEMMSFLARRLGALDLRYTVTVQGAGSLAALVGQTNAFIQSAGARATDLGSSLFRLQTSGRPATVNYPAARYIRLPLFLFFLGEALLRPGLPLYLAGLSAPGDLDGNTLAGIAMSMFLLTSIFGVLLGGQWAETRGLKGTILTGMVVITLGTALHTMISDITLATVARGVSGFGYGLTYAAAQLYVLRHTDPGRRTGGFSFFFMVVVAAEISGPAIGGILTDRIGAELVFWTATGSMALAVAVAAIVLPAQLPNLPGADTIATAPRAPDSPAQPMALWRNLRFVILIVCFSMPGKMLLNGGLFLAVPLAVAELALDATVTGRLIMTYGLVILAVGPALAWFADRYAVYPVYTTFGTILAAAAFLLPGLLPELGVLFVSIALFGIGQAMSVPAQMTLLLGLTEKECTSMGAGVVIGRYRFYERLGSFLGPVGVAALLIVATPAEAIFVLGLVSLVLAIVGAMIFMAVGNRDEEDAINALLVKD